MDLSFQGQMMQHIMASQAVFRHSHKVARRASKYSPRLFINVTFYL